MCHGQVLLDRRAVVGAGIAGVATDRGTVKIKISGSFFLEGGQIVEWFELVEPQG